MNSKCPVNYFLSDCSSEEHGLDCSTCYHINPLTTVVNKYKEPFDIYIGRGSDWGNPFEMKDKSEEERNRVCDLFEKWFWTTDLPSRLHELKGKVLGCFCKPKRCHGDFLASEVNELI